MSVQLLPGIGELDKGSLCYSIYIQLYNHFFNAQQKKGPDSPYGIEEGDDTSIRLHNTAYGFADAIAGSVSGEGTGGSGGVLIDYLKKSGGDMSGTLRANYGFEAGAGNTCLLRTYYEDQRHGIQFYGDVQIGGENLIIGGRRLLGYAADGGVAWLEADIIDFKGASIRSTGEMLFGSSKEDGVFISPVSVQIKGRHVWHEGNANLPSADWSMKDAGVAGALYVTGDAVLSGLLRAVHGFELGIAGTVLLSGTAGHIHTNAFLSFGTGYGVKIGGVAVLIRVNEGDIQLGAVGADLLLGSEQTHKIRLFAGISDIDGDHILLTKYGAAYFPDSLTVRHNYGDDLLSSYRNDSFDEGMIIHKYLRFGTSTGAMLYGNSDGITFSSLSEHRKTEGSQFAVCETSFSHRPSTSSYRTSGRDSDSLFISTSADFITTGKPLEATGHIGIDGSLTRLSAGAVYFDNERYLLAVTGGIKHYGNSVFLGTLSSEYFASGFAGGGWAISRNRTTGNIVATFDELTIRKKMRIYELEVQKNSATNGSLWVSDSCSGDRVEKL